MKKLILLAMVLGMLVSGLPFSVLAADMPDGFIGLKWGHSLDKMRDEGLFDRVIINDKNPDKQVAWVSTKRFNPLPNLKEYGIILYFYKDKLYAGSIMIKEYRDWNLLTEAIIEKYGTPFSKEMKNVNGNLEYWNTMKGGVDIQFPIQKRLIILFLKKTFICVWWTI